MEHSQYKGTLIEGLEDNQVAPVYADPHDVAQFRTCNVVKRAFGNLLAVLTYFPDERNSTLRIVERDVVADLFQVCFGLRREVCAHSLAAVFGHPGVFSFKTVEDLGGGLRFTAAATLIDFPTQAVDYSLAAPLIFFQEAQAVTNDLAGGGITTTFHLFLDEGLEMITDCVARRHGINFHR